MTTTRDHAAAIAAKMAELDELHGDWIREQVATWPPLTEAQRADLALILHPSPGHRPHRAEALTFGGNGAGNGFLGQGRSRRTDIRPCSPLS
jgi:hypothetical protein